MKKVLIGLIAILIVLPATVVAKSKNYDIMGTYAVTGYNPGTSTSGDPSYTGELKISQSGGAYLLDWKLGEQGKQAYRGVGIYADGILSVGFDGGVVSYKIEGEGKELKGVWAPVKGGPFGYEFCSKK